ncbi:MAG: hypothetical protein ACRDIB_06540 [Ardenticatenaceae bacterium]
MRPNLRVIIALTIMLSGFALVPVTGWSAEGIEWQRYAEAYEDVVTITRVRYDRSDRELEVRATSSDPNAQLRVFETGTGQLIGVMENRGGGEFRLETTWPRNPRAVTVRSSSGGAATARVTRG